MIVTFKTKSYPDIILFGDVAKTLLGMMGHSGSVPGAIRAEDIGTALQKLRAAVDQLGQESASGSDQTSKPEGGEDEPQISLQQRAFPLLEMLAAADQGGHDLIWE
ncbi:MAG: DUF1840 domain-containing protein [Gammaproteobacteria bacterium]